MPVSFLFGDVPKMPSLVRKKSGEAPLADFVTEFVASADGHTLIKAFLRINAPEVRRSIVRMVEAISALRASG